VEVAILGFTCRRVKNMNSIVPGCGGANQDQDLVQRFVQSKAYRADGHFAKHSDTTTDREMVL